MSDRLVEDDEVSVDETKQQAIAKHYSDIESYEQSYRCY